MTESIEERVLNFIDKNAEQYIKVSHRIHERPEVGNEEFYASKVLSELLEEEDFKLERNIAGHETGFIATYEGAKQGPVISYLAEYDALPGLGHACGHNIIGTSSVLSAIALKQVIDNVGGVIKVFGTPAEEGGVNGSAKASYVKAGLFKDSDVALMIHPGADTYRTVPTLAVDVFEVEFFGKSAHASESAYKGINALDMMVTFFNGIAQLRQHIKPKDRVHGIILDGGSSANIVPDYTKARFYTRALSRVELDELTRKVERIAQGAALQASGDMKFSHIQNGVNEFVINQRLDDLFEKHALRHQEDVKYDDFGFGSTDTGNVSHIVPTIHPHIKMGPSSLIGHTNEFREAAKSKDGDRALLQSARIMATMALELIEKPALLKDIQLLHDQLKG